LLVEVGVGTGFPVDPADDLVPVVDGCPINSFTREPVVSGRYVVPVAPTSGDSRFFAIGNSAKDHDERFTRSSVWRVIGVRVTERVEEVFCAVVPDLYRFTLASGILTGNSYPIADKADLKRAVQAYGRAKASDQKKVRDHIKRRAAALGASDMVPDGWFS